MRPMAYRHAAPAVAPSGPGWRGGMAMRCGGLAAGLGLVGALIPVLARAESPRIAAPEIAVTALDAAGLKTERKGGLEPAYDVSGIACLPPDGSGARACLVVNDQDTFAQRATLTETGLQGGDLVPLIDKEHRRAILGRKPDDLACSQGKGGFKDLDGEGVAYAAPYFYVVGSHGCARRARTSVHSAFILTRVRVDAAGAPVGEPTEAVEATYRLNAVLASAQPIAGAYGHDLNEADGLNIEGIAILGDRVVVGLRAPSIGGRAFLVAAESAALFAPGHDAVEIAAEVIPLALGEGVGIRDLAPLPDGRLLVLSGPTREQADIPFRLQAVEPRTGGAVETLAEVADRVGVGGRRAKAEAALPLDPAAKRILVLFDGFENGGPRVYARP